MDEMEVNDIFLESLLNNCIIFSDIIVLILSNTKHKSRKKDYRFGPLEIKVSPEDKFCSTHVDILCFGPKRKFIVLTFDA